ncbi:lipocalin-like domain-containing protein [Sinomicrobium soli]|uniref:lipocalin family protein n=1 Tax=Sinomicrobium sp. N-1-3-6 TaxID=2219864 RepID=UPI000DCC4C79|nr:lipocalin family protein [Sinomicrobium sp. N-1-3-6]RAV28091.1 hypothetical protein DN748_15440 [Sinomicrobium sp. N-1-3-6]
MKNLILIISVFLFVSCSNDDDAATPRQQITGTWTLAEAKVGTGAPGKWEPVSEGYSYTFGSDGTFSSDRFSGCTAGTYVLSEDTLVLEYDCEGFTTGMEEPEGTFSESISFEGGKMILTPTYMGCIEGCSYKFEKTGEVE